MTLRSWLLVSCLAVAAAAGCHGTVIVPATDGGSEADGGTGGASSCVCGDGVCEAACGEDDTTCFTDCDCAGAAAHASCAATCVCGDGSCDPSCGENATTCFDDCDCASADADVNACTPCLCGDGVCDPSCEDTESCPGDCP